MSRKDIMEQPWLDALIEQALSEDIGTGDVTTESVVNQHRKARAVWISKQNGIIAGLGIGKKVFQFLDRDIIWKSCTEDGSRISDGEVIATIEGNARAILTAERVALNIVQRMSGIATQTAEMVNLLMGSSTRILDTRKTVPGLRLLDKYAVKTGGGLNHRIGLFDMALVKENHIRAAGGITPAVQKIRSHNPVVKIEVETTTLDEVKEAVDAGADMIMLDNMDNTTMRKAVGRIGEQAETEASGSMTAGRLREVAETGVDYISVGALTHSVAAFDISQQIKEIY